MRAAATIFFISLASSAFAQTQSVADQVLQNMIGNLAMQNAKLVEQVQKLTTENETLKKQMEAKEQKGK